MKPTDTIDILTSINAGIFAQQIGQALSDVGAGCVDYNKVGQVRIIIDMKKVGDGNQVNAIFTMDYKAPTKRGKKGRTEDLIYSTPLYVTSKGLTFFQPDPTKELFPTEAARQVSSE